MPSFLDKFLTPLRNTYTKNVQPLFVDAKNYLYDSASQDVKDRMPNKKDKQELFINK